MHGREIELWYARDAVCTAPIDEAEAVTLTANTCCSSDMLRPYAQCFVVIERKLATL
jgi:hypothetical protein